ncbi:CHAD domain-containing protein [Streptomyces sp. NPDC047042]|uniref:CHAD domain-containing protein n=1 Tax=Streptomyces sp. NPDC047042 TaxID=3154807 RepID=UPI0033DCD960
MAQQHLDPTDPTTAGPVTADALADYLRAQATEFLRALRLHRETGPGSAAPGEEPVDAARALRHAARRITGTLHTFRPLLDPTWAEAMHPELAWLSGTLAREHAYAARLNRLLQALQRLSGTPALPTQQTTTVPSRPAPAPAAASRTAPAVGSRSAGADPVPRKAEPATGGPRTHPAAPPDRANLTLGAAKAGALLERQLTLARTRAHSAALQALGSSRFHAVADNVAVLASEVPLTPAAASPTTPTDLRPLALAAHDRLCDAVTALPLLTAGHPYNAEALIHGLSADPAPHPQDAPWHHVRLLLRLRRYALEVIEGDEAWVDVRMLAAGAALNRHRDASEAAAAAAAAARTPRIAPATAYALGVLHADQRHEVEAARFAFQQSWEKKAMSTR